MWKYKKVCKIASNTKVKWNEQSSIENFEWQEWTVEHAEKMLNRHNYEPPLRQKSRHAPAKPFEDVFFQRGATFCPSPFIRAREASVLDWYEI